MKKQQHDGECTKQSNLKGRTLKSSQHTQEAEAREALELKSLPYLKETQKLSAGLGGMWMLRDLLLRAREENK